MNGVENAMMPAKSRFLAAAKGQPTDRPPVWLMRQAGRYLPEYRSIRADHSFIEAISTPAIATEISLQPWERFHPDGVVMYSDILTALEPLGLSYQIESGVGPVVDSPIQSPTDVERTPAPIEETLSYVGAVLGNLKNHLAERAAVIGFVGGPFTLACYTVEGEPSRDFMQVRRFRYEHESAFKELLELFGDVLVEYVQYQEAHGADVIQIFDTYASLLSTPDYREYLLPVHKRIIDASRVPTIIFARSMGDRLPLLVDSGADVIGLDWTVELHEARMALDNQAVQGNLDPSILFAPPSTIRKRTRELIAAGGQRGHIINLGHGVHKSTPLVGVETFFDTVKASA